MVDSWMADYLKLASKQLGNSTIKPLTSNNQPSTSQQSPIQQAKHVRS
jgi:hypothetical protein